MERRLETKNVRRRNLFLWGLALYLVSLLPSVAVPAAKFTATLDRDIIILGETVTLTMTFEGVNPGGMPQLPAIPGLQRAGGQSSGSNMTLGPDGQMPGVHHYSVPLVATQVGEFTVPAFQIEVEGQKLSSQPLKLRVIAEDPTTPPAEFAQKPAFLWLVLPKRDIYVGEAVPAEMRLYLRSEIGTISNPQIPNPTGEGFNNGSIVQGPQFRRRVGNAEFNVLPLMFSLTPVKTGPLKLSPINGSVVIHFGGQDFFGRYSQNQRVALALEAQAMQVMPLPAGDVPADFNGAIGNFTLTSSAGPTNVAVGDPITVRLQISGRGALDAVTLPPQTTWNGFKIYPPTASVQTTDKLGLQGTKTFEQIVTPENTELKELPAFSFSFFDPELKQYRTLAQPAVPLLVRPSTSTATQFITSTTRPDPTVPPPAQDIVHIKPRLGTLTSVGPPLIQRPWFIALQSVPVLAWLAAVGWRKRAESLARNPRLRRQRLVAQIIRDGLVELQAHAQAKKSDEFFATLIRLLQEQLGERLDCPASAITEAVVDEKLRPRGVAEATLNELHELFQACNLARYAPVQSSQELAALVPRFEAIVRELQTLKT